MKTFGQVLNELSLLTCWQSEAIVTHFQSHGAPGKMVDFCLVVRPNAHEQDVINSLCKSRPSLTINHTNWGKISKHPIALSIETKRQGEQLDEAFLQIGTWHSSQWRRLRYRGCAAGTIDFLPGIITHGHDWLFVATTLGEDLEATTYSSLRIGDTSSALGTYKLLAALQRLTTWCEATHWPAYRADVLGMSTAESSSLA
ncbi:hypothetical protein HRG_001194 [Hirsutella rhossiliensis]|uniref:PD-(D/E)XK nuclease-like domain-containing protein n=1 Tax=Hirsutella rhossiliensis TaxID=111463 RepID=A0A9P8N7S3_9HYPO|nr:uncharacterized protein HRG_01194 [Hirsutella rhossiliensis]KAH0968552.1 hypothetical protein HRG_01194 [Hirsutella rhossiliensis]